MIYPAKFADLPTATWPRLRALLDPIAPGKDPINMTIGEPKHRFPDWVPAKMAEGIETLNSYPNNTGTEALLSSIGDWLARRYSVSVDPSTQVLALNGTREGLYNAAMALIPETNPVVLVPNPFYQVYAVAALSVGAEPVYMNATADNGFLPDFSTLDEDTLNRTAVAYVCSPANPQGTQADEAYWTDVLALAEKYDFRIFADECYSEIYRGSPPVGVLEVAAKVGANPERIVAFHSLSKRSNVPGLRSGFCVGGPKTMSHIRSLRAYAGAPLPGPVQHVSAALWADEAHVVANRDLYCDKFSSADHIFAGIEGYQSPNAGFFLWLPVSDGAAAAVELWRKEGVRTLPGAFLSRQAGGENPGEQYIRVALVAPKAEAVIGLQRIRDCLY